MRFFSYRDRPVHLGPYPLERLKRSKVLPDLSGIPAPSGLSFEDAARPESLTHAMARFVGMFDVVRDGSVANEPGEIPADPSERANHFKAAAYYFDSSMVGICKVPTSALLAEPIRNPMVKILAEELENSQPKSFAAGIDMILSDVLDSARKIHAPIDHHSHAIVLLVEYPRDPRADEAGAEWIVNTQAQRAATLSAQTAVLLSTYLRMLGHPARAHTATCTDVHLGKLAVAAGLVEVTTPNGVVELVCPYVGTRYGLAAVTTTLDMTCDQPLATGGMAAKVRSHGPAWWVGKGTLKSALNREPYQSRDFRMGPQPFEKLKRRDTPTTFIDHERVPRFPKRADFFARILFGDNFHFPSRRCKNN